MAGNCINSIMKVTGLDRITRKLKELPAGATEVVVKELIAGAANIKADAQAKAPRFDGRLFNSITVRRPENGKAGAEVVVGANYGGYVEFGTGKKVRIPSRYAQVAAEVKAQKTPGSFKQFVDSLSEWVRKKGIITNGKRGRVRKDDKYRLVAYWMAIRILQNGVPAQPYFFPAFEKNERKIYDNCRKALGAFLKKK
jgi:HK97 gp10 family phage protein